ncbi:uncharacterized protein LOC122498826 [Leptopilina heterotoma]|uniref:uncharacterized protein LOC122498826 n=1 Tax=Leptopilina heterotoma TaxID=63436 RepID=UPI001CA8D462|nr:uncharacterized protein LOC122498826 [Leptopilina heterotoma]
MDGPGSVSRELSQIIITRTVADHHHENCHGSSSWGRYRITITGTVTVINPSKMIIPNQCHAVTVRIPSKKTVPNQCYGNCHGTSSRGRFTITVPDHYHGNCHSNYPVQSDGPESMSRITITGMVPDYCHINCHGSL